MNDPLQTPIDLRQPTMVAAGADRFGYFKLLGISSVAFKVTSQESSSLFVAEISLDRKGGPAKHVHLYEDEYFYILEGEFIVEIGDKRYHLKPGDSAFGPQKIPHAWAFVAGTHGRFLGVISPVAQIEAFLREQGKTNILPGSDPNQWQPYGMEWVGPPLSIG